MSVPWPTELPCLRIEGTQSVSTPALQRSRFDAGNTRQRRQHFHLPHGLRLSCVMTQAQREFALTWLRVNAGETIVVQAPSFLSGDEFASDMSIKFAGSLNFSSVFSKQDWLWLMAFDAIWDPADNGYVPQIGGDVIIAGSPGTPSPDWYISSGSTWVLSGSPANPSN